MPASWPAAPGIPSGFLSGSSGFLSGSDGAERQIIAVGTVTGRKPLWRMPVAVPIGPDRHCSGRQAWLACRHPAAVLSEK